MATPTVGQIGLGTMGGNVARHLLDEGFDVIGYDISDDALDAFVEYGGTPAESNAAVAAEADVVLTALKDPAIVEEVYLGDQGVLKGASAGSICIEQSTVPPETTRTVGEHAEPIDVDVLDAPFGGGPENCRNGSLVLTVGGAPEAFERDRAQAVLEALSSELHYMGPLGAGDTTKLVNNIMSIGNIVLALEAMSMGVAQGIEPGTLFRALKNHGGTSRQFRAQLPKVLNRDFDPVFPVSYAQKDLKFALEAGEAEEFPMYITSLMYQLYTEAAAKGHAEENTAAVVKVFEDYIGQPVEAEDHVEVIGMDEA